MADYPFLAEMLVEAGYPPSVMPRPTPAHALANRFAGLYLFNWGRPGDRGVIVEVEDRPIGAAWYRRFPAAEPGYGFVADDVPEIAIALVVDQRGRGVGQRLLAALIDAAVSSGERALSLSVSARNPAAVAIYTKAGFVRVGGDDDSPTMLLDLAGR